MTAILYNDLTQGERSKDPRSSHDERGNQRKAENEYIRNRRLTLAAQELRTTNLSVIDAAYKYGYESPESFSKAFSRFHGSTPFHTD